MIDTLLLLVETARLMLITLRRLAIFVLLFAALLAQASNGFVHLHVAAAHVTATEHHHHDSQPADAERSADPDPDHSHQLSVAGSAVVRVTGNASPIEPAAEAVQRFTLAPPPRALTSRRTASQCTAPSSRERHSILRL